MSALAASAILLGAAFGALGRPDLAAAGGFLTGEYPTDAAAIAVASSIVWALILVTVIVLIGSRARTAVSASTGRVPLARALLILVCGLVLLAGGAHRHASAAYQVCCGSLQEARDLAH